MTISGAKIHIFNLFIFVMVKKEQGFEQCSFLFFLICTICCFLSCLQEIQFFTNFIRFNFS